MRRRRFSLGQTATYFGLNGMSPLGETGAVRGMGASRAM